MLKDLVLKNRSYRRFYENETISIDTLKELVDLARTIPCGANGQVLKYFLVNTKNLNDKVFPNIGWAGYLKDWDGPSEGERPSAYIIMLNDRTLSQNRRLTDEGIAAQTIMLGAVEKGLGGCMLGNVKKDNLYTALNIDKEKYEIAIVMAVGKPKETVVIDEMKDGDIKYWRDSEQIHHVPKRSLEEIIVK